MKGVTTLSAELKQAAKVWPAISNIVSVPRTEQEYERTVTSLDELIDKVGENKRHTLASLLDTLGTLIDVYEDKHFPESTSTPAKTLYPSDNHKPGGPASTNLRRREGGEQHHVLPDRLLFSVQQFLCAFPEKPR